MTNVEVLVDGDTALAALPDGHSFLFDSDKLDTICSRKWYCCAYGKKRAQYITDSRGHQLHRVLMGNPAGCEVDHINLDTMDNRSVNLRLVTHQQNQINQPLQRNNTSGVSGVRYYRPRQKYSARLKISQHEIHLGYYLKFEEAVQARNVGMLCMFGEYGRYNDVPEAPDWIREKVIHQCKRFVDLSLNKAFLLAS